MGETGRAAKERLYEHRVISHKDAKRSHSLGDVDANPLSEPQGERKSQRGAQRKDYNAMHSGKGQLFSVGDTIVSEHMATLDHDADDIDHSCQLLKVKMREILSFAVIFFNFVRVPPYKNTFSTCNSSSKCMNLSICWTDLMSRT